MPCPAHQIDMLPSAADFCVPAYAIPTDLLHIAYFLVSQETAPFSRASFTDARVRFFPNAGQQPPARVRPHRRKGFAQGLHAAPDSAVTQKDALRNLKLPRNHHFLPYASYEALFSIICHCSPGAHFHQSLSSAIYL